MSFLPFVRQGGQRIVRWPGLVAAWVLILAATLSGSCTMGYALVGDWRYGVFAGLAMGVACATGMTVLGFTMPIDRLPPIEPRSPVGAGPA